MRFPCSLVVGVGSACIVALIPAVATAATPAPAPVCTATTCTVTFPFLQDVYTYSLPTGVDTMNVTVRGASSGSGLVEEGLLTVPGAQGATVQATLTGVGGQALFVYTGGRGTTAYYQTATPSVQYTGGGWHGGGNAPGSTGQGTGSLWAAGGGGGSSDIRIGSDTDANRIVVAGGAGGAPGGRYLGYGGIYSIGTRGGIGASGGNCLEPAVTPGCSFRNETPPARSGTNGAYATYWGDGAVAGGGGGGYRGGLGGTAVSGNATGSPAQPGSAGTSYVSATYRAPGTNVVVTAGANGFASGGAAVANPAPTLVDGEVIITYSRPAPAAPTAPGAISGNGQATVTWTDSAPNAVAADVTGYTATASPGGQSCTAASGATGCPITGLTNGVTYLVTVKANSAAGDSVASSAATVVPVGPLAPVAAPLPVASPSPGAWTQGTQSGAPVTVRGAVTATQSAPITRAHLLAAAGFKAPAGAKVTYRVAGARGGLTKRGAALVGARPGVYRVTVTVTPVKGPRRVRTITVRIT